MVHHRTWGDGGRVVLALHGITSSHKEFELLGRRLADDCRLVAPDLRGRGDSSRMPGPFGFAHHAADLVDLLDHLGVERCTVVGHSMGGYLATVLAADHPDRVESVLLVDGGLPLQLPPGLSVDETLDLVVGPAVTRLSMTFPSREAYRDFWRAHPAFVDAWTPEVEAWVDYDFSDGRSRASIDAVREDGADILLPDLVTGALLRLSCPIAVLRAELGMLGAPPPFLPDELAGEWVARVPTLTDLGTVPGTNHYTIVLGDRGADAVAEAARGLDR